MRINFFVSSIVIVAAMFVASAQAKSQGSVPIDLIERSEVTFVPLNPARGKKGPQAGVLWGDIRQDVPSGMLVKFVDGFASPPHIHNITYRAVVIDGLVHNDDPSAARMWMGPGSFWTQPLGENHITAAKGKNTTIFLEISSGPYLVKPAKELFDGGERPINIDARNIIWLDTEDTTWISGNGPQLAYLWGSTEGNEKNGTFVKLPSGYKGVLSTVAPLMRVVTIQGEMDVRIVESSDKQRLQPGSYFGTRGEASHELACASKKTCLLYIHTEGKYQLKSQW